MPKKGWRKNADGVWQPPPEADPTPGPICEDCWPKGWPHPACGDAECVHGHYHRKTEE